MSRQKVKWAFKEGDLVTREKAMGVVIEVDGRFVKMQFVEGTATHEWLTANITVKQYLKQVRANAVSKGVMARNITLDQQLVEARDAGNLEAFISNESETQKNKS